MSTNPVRPRYGQCNTADNCSLDAFSIRKFLRTLGVSAQREIEKAVRQALAEGKLRATKASRRWR
jgi:hypothetical protein